MKDLWGGRFAEPLDAALRRFSTSLPVDRRLVRHDLACSRAHAEGLGDAGLLTAEEVDALLGAIAAIEREVDAGLFPPVPRGEQGARSRDASASPLSPRASSGGPAADAPSDEATSGAETEFEDIHSAVEARLVELCGAPGLKLHAGRSRNDQVVTDVLLWVKDASTGLVGGLRELQEALVAAGEKNGSLITFAYTHLQRAQPVLLAHHLLAHFEALDRDVERIRDAARRADRSPLGAGACAGSTLPLDRKASARRLGFARVSENSIDAVADRDWAIELVAACALVMAHLSRLAEEIVLWTSSEFGRARLSDAWSTGSSMMPHKRNPDVAELVRGRAGRVYGSLVALLTIVKALPLAYNRDLQEDKEALFDAVDTTRESARMLAGALRNASFEDPRPAGPDFSAATDLAEELVRRGVPFRTAHERIGRLVAGCEARGRGLPDATEAELEEAGLGGLDRALLTPAGGIAAKRTLGSTSPAEVERALAAARSRLRA